MIRIVTPSDRKLVKYFALVLVLATAALGGLFGQTGTAFATSGIKAGVLTCHSLPDTRANRVLDTLVRLRCVFDTPHGQEHYMGKIGIGLGIDWVRRPETEIRFTVLMASTDIATGSHSLAGYYIRRMGSSAGASVLTGGESKRISLEPLDLETGSRLAAGLSHLVLRPSR